MRILPLLALIAVPLSSPLLAQSELPAAQRELIIFGDDKCPADTICVTAPESERYRIPKQLRAKPYSPENESWSLRAQAALEAGKSGIGSCTAIGSGGWTGCYMEEMRKAREEAKQRAAGNKDLP